MLYIRLWLRTMYRNYYTFVISVRNSKGINTLLFPHIENGWHPKFSKESERKLIQVVQK